MFSFRRLLALTFSTRSRFPRKFSAGTVQRGFSPSWLLTLGATLGAGLALTWVQAENKKPISYDEIRKKIEEVLEDLDYDDGSFGPVFVRLAWHASGTYDAKTKTGGSSGATMRYNSEARDGANAGLDIARSRLEKIKKSFPEISYADLWTLAAVVAIKEMGGPEVDWKPGRQDHVDSSRVPPNGRLPDATRDGKHLQDVFYRMGFNDQEIVALAGAHSLGRCHQDRSGFSGPWTRSPITFTNHFFVELLNNKWTVKPGSDPIQYQDPTGDLMMLPTDLALLKEPFRKFVELYAKDEDKFFKDFASAFAKLLELGVQR